MINLIYRTFCKHKKVLHLEYDGTILEAYYQCEKCKKIFDYKSLNVNESKQNNQYKNNNLWM